MRLSSLRLLSSSAVEGPEGTSELLKKILQAEEVSIDVQGVRERVLRIGKLPLVVKDGDDRAAEICARWLIGEFDTSYSQCTMPLTTYQLSSRSTYARCGPPLPLHYQSLQADSVT